MWPASHQTLCINTAGLGLCWHVVTTLWNAVSCSHHLSPSPPLSSPPLFSQSPTTLSAPLTNCSNQWRMSILYIIYTGSMIWCPTLSYYPDTGLICPCPINVIGPCLFLLMPTARLGSDKYEFYNSLTWLMWDSNSNLFAWEACALPIKPPWGKFQSWWLISLPHFIAHCPILAMPNSRLASNEGIKL